MVVRRAPAAVRHAVEVTAHFPDRVEAVGFRDAWRHRFPNRREFSRFTNRGNGFRLDHTCFSASLATRAGAILYSHTERELGPSDCSLPRINPRPRVGEEATAART
jgi:exonuclease III